MSGRSISLGDVLLISLPAHAPEGREQVGVRPAVVVGLPESLGVPRFPLCIVAPLTTREGEWSRRAPDLFPRLGAGSGGLTKDSTVLLDQVRSVDPSRVRGYLGSLSGRDFDPIQSGVRRIFGL